MTLWDDIGPISQGKILTAIMQGRREDAEDMLRGWTVDDLGMLARAAEQLRILALQACANQRLGLNYFGSVDQADDLS